MGQMISQAGLILAVSFSMTDTTADLDALLSSELSKLLETKQQLESELAGVNTKIRKLELALSGPSGGPTIASLIRKALDAAPDGLIVDEVLAAVLLDKPGISIDRVRLVLGRMRDRGEIVNTGKRPHPTRSAGRRSYVVFSLVK